MDEATRKRSSSRSAVINKRGRLITGPFGNRIHALQIRAAFIRGQLGSNRQQPELIDAAREDLRLLLADFAQVSAAFDEAAFFDTDNPRVIDTRGTLSRIGRQLADLQTKPRAIDPFSFAPYPASLMGKAG